MKAEYFGLKLLIPEFPAVRPQGLNCVYSLGTETEYIIGMLVKHSKTHLKWPEMMYF